VVFKLDGGNADFPFILTDYHLPICKADGDSIDWQSGDGCGATSSSSAISACKSRWSATRTTGATMWASSTASRCWRSSTSTRAPRRLSRATWM
jgi:hypothetical protein